jgi:enoyl-CoA hydratase/carnithine racemase
VVEGGNRPRTTGQEVEMPGLFSYFFEAPKPIICAINGIAVGGGFTLLAKCDVRICSSTASFSTIFMKRGLIAEHGMTGAAASRRPICRLRPASHQQAHRCRQAFRIGLVDYVVEPDDLSRVPGPHSNSSRPRHAAGCADSKIIYRHMGMPQRESFREAEVVQWQAVARPDATEGTRALIEKREPVFAPLPRP